MTHRRPRRAAACRSAPPSSTPRSLRPPSASPLGAPALRVRGPLFALLTLAFAVAANSWIFNQIVVPRATGRIANIPRGSLGPIDLASQRSYYYLCLVVVAFVAARPRPAPPHRHRARHHRRPRQRARRRRASPSRRRSRSSPPSASPGALAGLAGALLGGLQVQFGSDSFRPDLSFLVVSIAVIGGLGSVAGAILGAVYVLGVPALLRPQPRGPAAHERRRACSSCCSRCRGARRARISSRPAVGRLPTGTSRPSDADDRRPSGPSPPVCDPTREAGAPADVPASASMPSSPCAPATSSSASAASSRSTA